MRKVMLVLILCLLLAACSSSQTDESPQQLDGAALEQGCLDGGGTFLAEYNECENVSDAACTELGGTFDACASACRHEPEADFCTAQCIPLCSFTAEG